MPLTREQMTIMAMNLNDEVPGTPGYETARFIYNALIDEGTDVLAQMGALYDSVVADIAPGQSIYTLPQLYRVDDIVCLYSNAQTSQPLRQYLPFDMDTLYPSWRTQPATGWPTTAVFMGNQSVALYPQPDYSIGSGASLTCNIVGGSLDTITVDVGGSGYGFPTLTFVDGSGNPVPSVAAVLTVTNQVITNATVTVRGSGLTALTAVIHTGGLLVTGYITPSLGGPGGTNMWPLQSSVFPLNQPSADRAVVYYAAMTRCAQHPTPDNKVRFPLWEKRWTDLQRVVYRAIMQSNRALRTADSLAASGSGGAWYGS